MGPGNREYDVTLECVVSGTSSRGASSIAASGSVHVWNGCTEVTPTSTGTLAALFEGPLGTISEVLDGFPALLLGGSKGTIYTYGPNCIDYQRYFEKLGYTVRQRDGAAP